MGLMRGLMLNLLRRTSGLFSMSLLACLVALPSIMPGPDHRTVKPKGEYQSLKALRAHIADLQAKSREESPTRPSTRRIRSRTTSHRLEAALGRPPTAERPGLPLAMVGATFLRVASPSIRTIQTRSLLEPATGRAGAAIAKA